MGPVTAGDAFPAFIKSRYSGSAVSTTRGPTTGRAPQVATSASLLNVEPTPAFVFARVFAADGSERRVANGNSLFANSEISRVWGVS